MRRTVPFLFFMGALLLFFAFSPHVEAAMFNQSLNGTYIIVDGMTNGVLKTNNTGATAIYMGDAGAGAIRGWICYNISDLDAGITISVLYFRYAGGGNNGDATIRSMTLYPNGSAPMDLFWDVGNGTVYAGGAASGFPVVGVNQQITLNAQAIADLETAINASQGWFTIGFMAVSEAPGNHAWINSTEFAAPTPEPTLYLEYDYDYQYTFTGGYYENGTAYNDTITVRDSDGGEFLLFKNSTNQGYTSKPELFYWDIGGGYARHIYSIDAENITVLIPEDTFYAYSFTIKDYTGKSSEGNTFLEAYRTINGTETLVERGKFITGNTVPLNLVYGRTYHLRILWSDGTRYNWGYYVPLSDTSPTLIIRKVSFSDQAHYINRYITVEASRTGTTIAVDYQDDRNRTIWANLTIRIRNGAVVHVEANNQSSKAFTWAGADEDTAYVVTLAGDHQDAGEWGYSKIFDASDSWPDAPSLTGIISLGGIDGTYIVGFSVWLVALITFSYQWQEDGMLAAMGIGTVLSTLGWANWGYNLLMLGWVIAVVAKVTSRRRTI